MAENIIKCAKKNQQVDLIKLMFKLCEANLFAFEYLKINSFKIKSLRFKKSKQKSFISEIEDSTQSNGFVKLESI